MNEIPAHMKGYEPIYADYITTN